MTRPAGPGRDARPTPRRVGVGVAVELANDLLRVPRGADFPVGIAGLEEPDKPRAAAVIETFVGLGQQPTATVERVVLVAPVTERLVLHPATDLVELLVGEFHEMKRISDL